MLSVGIYTYSTRPRGSVVHALSLAEALRFAGHDVTLYALSKAGDRLFRDTTCRVQLLPAEPAPSDGAALIRQRISEFDHGIRRLKPRHAIHHAEDCLAANALLEVRGELSGRIVRTVHHVERFESQYLLDCQRRSIAQVDGLFSVSELTRSEVLAEFGRDTWPVLNGVDRERLRRVPVDTNPLLRRLGIRPSDRVVLSVGGIEPRKNSLRALAAIARAYDREPKLRWVIAGGASIWDHSDYRDKFDKRLHELPADLQARITTCGVLTDAELAALYARAEVLLCPSQKEGFGLCVLEALTTNTVVVASNAPPFTEYLDGETAVLVDPESVESIAHGLEQALSDRALGARLRPAGEARAAHYSWERSAAQHVAHYRALLADARG